MDYSLFDFPAYSFTEFPKWVEGVQVENAEEEAIVLADAAKSKTLKLKKTNDAS